LFHGANPGKQVTGIIFRRNANTVNVFGEMIHYNAAIRKDKRSGWQVGISLWSVVILVEQMLGLVSQIPNKSTTIIKGQVVFWDRGTFQSRFNVIQHVSWTLDGVDKQCGRVVLLPVVFDVFCKGSLVVSHDAKARIGTGGGGRI